MRYKPCGVIVCTLLSHTVVLSLNSIHVFCLRMQCVMLPVEVQHVSAMWVILRGQSDMYNPLKTVFTTCVSYQILSSICMYLCEVCVTY